MCQIFHWKEGKTFAKQRENAKCSMKKKQKTFGAMKPRKSHLRIVTLPVSMFMVRSIIKFYSHHDLLQS